MGISIALPYTYAVYNNLSLHISCCVLSTLIQGMKVITFTHFFFLLNITGLYLDIMLPRQTLIKMSFCINPSFCVT